MGLRNFWVLLSLSSSSCNTENLCIFHGGFPSKTKFGLLIWLLALSVGLGDTVYEGDS